MHIKNFLYAAPHRELPAFLALNGGKVKKKWEKMKFVNGFVSGSQTLYGKRLYIKSLSALGRMLPSQTAKRIGQGNAIRPIFSVYGGQSGQRRVPLP